MRRQVPGLRWRWLTAVLLAAAMPAGQVWAQAAPLPPTKDADSIDTPAQTAAKVGAVVQDLAHGNIKALRRGPLLIHGNFCGIGGRPGLAPLDALDAACERHDSCTRTGKLPSCTCNERLKDEASAIVSDPDATADLKALSAAVAASMTVLICK